MAATEIALDELVECVADDASGASGPKYVRLFEAFSDCVISGRFKPGERVPTETELARNLPYSVGTVQKALAQLVSNGLIVRHRGTTLAGQQGFRLSLQGSGDGQDDAAVCADAGGHC